jgi:hypothetical protein
MASAAAQQMLAQAAQARQRGDPATARRLLEQLIAADPACAPAHNSLGLIALGSGDAAGALRHLGRAAELDPKAPGRSGSTRPIAQRALGRHATNWAALDRALAVEPYLLPGSVSKGAGAGAARGAAPMRSRPIGDRNDGRGSQRSAAAGSRPRSIMPAACVAGAADQQARASPMSSCWSTSEGGSPPARIWRAGPMRDQKPGRRKVYQQQPTAAHSPYPSGTGILPARASFPGSPRWRRGRRRSVPNWRRSGPIRQARALMSASMRRRPPTSGRRSITRPTGAPISCGRTAARSSRTSPAARPRRPGWPKRHCSTFPASRRLPCSPC